MALRITIETNGPDDMPPGTDLPWIPVDRFTSATAVMFKAWTVARREAARLDDFPEERDWT